MLPGAALPAVPACEDGAEAILADGLNLAYEGADPDDPETCLVTWNGRTYRYYAGFWGAGRFAKGTPAERTAIWRVLTGPVGAKAAFDDRRAGLWGKVTIEHIANPVLELETGPRRAVLLRVVKHDSRNRPDVKAETLHWIDARTGVALKRQAVTTLSDGRQIYATTWQVDRLVPAEQAASGPAAKPRVQALRSGPSPS